jgi:arsenate reductase
MKLLFMCVANSARSQVAEGLAKQIFPDAEIESAGSHPGKLSSYAVAVMNEIGIDISKHHSKSTDDLSSEFLSNLDYVITLCAEEVCPTVISKAKKLHWPMPDPFTTSEHETLKRFKEIRDAIREKLLEFEQEIQ